MAESAAPPETLMSVVAERVRGALAESRAQSRLVTIAGATLKITAHDEVAPFVFAPFAHLHSISDRVDLRVDIAALRESDARELALDDVADSGVVATAEEVIVHLHAHSVSVLDRASARIYTLLRHANGVASWHRAKPLQVPLSIFFADRGIDFLHGGMISLHGTGVLVAGAGGSGKSTLTLASLLHGLDLLGDDCVGLRASDGRFDGFSIFGSASVEREHLCRFTMLSELAADPGEAKTVLPLAQLFPDRMATTTKIRAIVLPRVTHAEHVTIRPATGKEALLALAPSSILKRAIPAGPALARMTRMARQLPAFRLEMGPVAELGPRVRTLLEELRS